MPLIHHNLVSVQHIYYNLNVLQHLPFIIKLDTCIFQITLIFLTREHNVSDTYRKPVNTHYIFRLVIFTGGIEDVREDGECRGWGDFEEGQEIGVKVLEV
jgi:hypothetical protein